jgi:hypothetical protein
MRPRRTAQLPTQQGWQHLRPTPIGGAAIVPLAAVVIGMMLKKIAIRLTQPAWQHLRTALKGGAVITLFCNSGDENEDPEE